MESAIEFDEDRNLIRQFDFDTHKGEFEWIQVGETFFPRLIRYQSKAKESPSIVIETSEHATVPSIDKDLFQSSSFDLSTVSKLITHRKGMEPRIQNLKPAATESMRDINKKLGVTARDSGFSKESK